MTYPIKIARIALLLVMTMVFSNQNLFSQSISVGNIDEYLVFQDQVQIEKSIKEKGFVFFVQNDSYGSLKFYNKKAELGTETFAFGIMNDLFCVIYMPVSELYSVYRNLLFTTDLIYSYSGAGSDYYENESFRIGFNDQEGIISLFANIIDIENVKIDSDQNSNQEEMFVTYKLNDFGYISIPNNLETQSELYKKYTDGIKKSRPCYYEILEKGVIFQQKGVNEFHKTDTYARVIIKTYSNGDFSYENLTEEILLTNEELNELDQMFKSDIENSFCDQRLLAWYGTEIVRVKTYYSMKVSYLRHAENYPPVFVEIYHFPDNDRLHELTMAYRVEDQDLWKPLFKKILESIIINQ